MRALLAADVIICTPEKWDGISRNWQKRSYVKKVALVVIDEIHLLHDSRGPVIESIVARTVRQIEVSHALKFHTCNSAPHSANMVIKNSAGPQGGCATPHLPYRMLCVLPQALTLLLVLDRGGRTCSCSFSEKQAA